MVYAAAVLPGAPGTPFICFVFIPQRLCAFGGPSKLPGAATPQAKLEEPEETEERKTCLGAMAPRQCDWDTKVLLLPFLILLPAPTFSLVFCLLYQIFGCSSASGRTHS